MRFTCTFLFFLFMLALFILVLWPFIDIHYTLFSYIYIYIYDVCFSSPISTCVVLFLSLYTCLFIYAILIFVSHMMPWWVLFKCFRKTGYESLPCSELSSCKVFQEFMLGLDLLCISTNDYDFSDLKLLSWYICLLWFCHELPKGRLLGTYLCNWLIFWQNPLYL